MDHGTEGEGAGGEAEDSRHETSWPVWEDKGKCYLLATGKGNT